MAERRCAHSIKKIIAGKRAEFVLYGFLFRKDGPDKILFFDFRFPRLQPMAAPSREKSR